LYKYCIATPSHKFIKLPSHIISFSYYHLVLAYTLFLLAHRTSLLYTNQAATPSTNAANPPPSPFTTHAPFFFAVDVEFADALVVEIMLPVELTALVIGLPDVVSGVARMEDETELDTVSR
jgi:hypothetical protein